MEENRTNLGSIPERRLPVALTTFAVVLLLAFTPSRIRLFPDWVFYGCAIIVLLPMIIVGIVSDKRRWLRIERFVTLGFCCFCFAGIITTLVILTRAILYHSAGVSGLQLLATSIAVWNANVLVFALFYWQIDRGGPEARLYDKGVKPDFHFPCQDFSGEIPLNWKPTFIDYLFLGFSTSTAFSMTEAVPITHRAKLLIMLQSSVSLVTLVVVGARAINILGG